MQRKDENREVWTIVPLLLPSQLSLELSLLYKNFKINNSRMKGKLDKQAEKQPYEETSLPEES